MKLVILQGDQRMDLQLEDGPQVIGRSSDCDIQITDQGISRQHLKVTPENGGLRVVDMGSRNAFKVRGSKVRETVLGHNEELTIGSISFIFQAHDDELPGASLPADDVTPIDAEFISTEADHAAVAPEPAPVVKAVPVRGIVPAPGGQSPQGGNVLLKNKKFLIMAAIPALVILIAIVQGLGGDPVVNPNPPVKPPVTPASDRDAYLNACTSSLEPFNVYFKDPSRNASRLKEAIALIQPALNDRKFSKIDIAPALSTIYATFRDVGVEYRNFDDTRLFEILDKLGQIRKERLADHKLKAFADNLERWCEEQLRAFNEVEPLRKAAGSRDLDELLDAHAQIQALNRDTIYAKDIETLETTMFERIGDIYINDARVALSQGDESTGRSLLAKASQFGREKEVSDILHGLNASAEDRDAFTRAQVAYDNDDLKLAETHLERISEASHLHAEAEGLRLKIERRRLLLEMRQHFTAGDQPSLENLVRNHALAEDTIVQNLLTQMRTSIQHYERARVALEEERYADARQAFLTAINSISKYDKDNFYRNESIRLAQELDANKLADKHYKRGVVAMQKTPPRYAEAREEFDIARQFDPIIAEKEIREMVDLASQRLQDYLTANARGTESDVAEAKRNLKRAIAWLRDNDPGSREHILYETIRSNLR